MSNTYREQWVEGGVLDDDMLMEQARRGDVAAYEQLVERYQDLAFRGAFLVTRDAGAAEDAAQEAFIKAYRALPRFRPGKPFRPWLMTIVSNEAKRRRAASLRQDRLPVQMLAGGHVTASRSVEAEVLASELREQLHRAIEHLNRTDQLVLVYRYVLGLSEMEMAAAMNCRPGTVKSRLSPALDRLRSTLAVREPELLRVGLIDA
ncbi:MAG TPA: RNA polymerase sigma factor [Chloroflexota bacterium]|nr:RNA polymerase sigma factor [Chloroflexota bacterium]